MGITTRLKTRSRRSSIRQWLTTCLFHRHRPQEYRNRPSISFYSRWKPQSRRDYNLHTTTATELCPVLVNAWCEKYRVPRRLSRQYTFFLKYSPTVLFAKDMVKIFTVSALLVFIKIQAYTGIRYVRSRDRAASLMATHSMSFSTEYNCRSPRFSSYRFVFRSPDIA